MDADVDSDWISTQAVVSTDIQPDNEQEKINDYGCIVLNGMIDDGRYVLKEGNNTIGRHPLNDIYIEHPSVSMNHAVIQCDSDGVVLLDKGSLNKTKLNKKNLRKDVAYFLEENSLLMFGEVQANYFINGESNEFINNTKSIASNNTSIHKETQNYGLSLSTLSNTINVSESLRTNIHNAITDCNVPSIIENSSTCMIEKAVPQTITRSECPVNTFDDIHEELISPSPSDEYLLEALSQIETMQNNIDSNKIFQNLSNKDTLTINTTESMPKVTREDTPSPVMDLKNSILTINNKTKSLCQSPNKINIEATREDTPSPVMDLGSSFITTNNISGSIFQSSDKINTELIREDTPSPTMDLENSFETTNNIPGRIFQTPNKINTELIREDTPSPIMDFGCYNDSENKIETNNPGIVSAIQSPNKDDELNNTQVLEISNFKSENTSISINQSLIQKQNLSMNNLFCKSQKVESGDQSNLTTTNVFDNHSNANLSCSNNINSNKKSSVKPAEHLNGIHNDGLHNDSEQNRSILTIPNLKSDTEGNNTNNYNINFNTFEADDDDIFSNFIENESKSQNQNLNVLENQDIFNSPTQKVSTDININLKSNVSNEIHKEKTQEILEFPKSGKDNSSLSTNNSTNIHEELTPIPEMDDDFFNCPTQKYAFPKKKNKKPKKTSSSIHEEETQRPSELVQFNKIKSSISNIDTEVLEIDNEDFFNCQTQKLSITKNRNPKPKVSSTIHEEETQVHEMHDDFFNCPTQKYAYPKKINENQKISSLIHEEETQNIFEFSKPNKNNLTVSKDNSTSIHEEETQVPELDDDFYNCPTQKLSIPKKINEKPKTSTSIHEEETQRPSELVQFNKTETSSSNTEINVLKIDNEDFFDCPTQKLSISKNTNPKPKVSSTIHEEETQVPEMHDDFFNCPTQKYAYPKKINEKPKISSSIHEEETQRPSELVKFNKTKTSTANTKTDIFIINNEDFFDFPTQKLSITKNTNQKPKVSSTIHEKETQNFFEFSKLNKNNLTVSKDNSTSIHEEETQVPELDDDFYNCPTQKLSIPKKINEKPKISSSIHEEETQRPSELVKFNKTKTGTSNTKTDMFIIDNEDFFDCPTQKLSITKNTNQKPKVSSTIHEKETQNIFEFSKPNKNNLTVSKDNSTSIHEEETQVPELDDDFYNCPTQKLSIPKKINEKPKISSSIHEEETQRPSELVKFNKTKTSTANTKTDIFIINNEDFFDCPTQKLSITKNTNQKPKVSSTIHEKETQNFFEFSKLNKNNLTVSKDNSTSIHEEETQVPDMDDDFYNCPTQKLSIPKKIHQSSNVATIANKENSQNPPEFSKLNKINTNISQTDSTNKHKNVDECTLNNHKITVEHDNENTDKVKKSKCVNSNIIRLSNVQLPAMCKENSSNSLKMDKPKIRVREDLCISYSSNSSNSSNSTVILNKPIERNTVMNNINTSVSLNENLNSPSCSKSPTDRENVFNMLSSIKQEHFSDDSAQSRVSISNKSNDRLKRMDESIFSPFNIPDISADSLSKHHSSSKTVEDNLNSLNCEPSTSNNDASIWKSFWNKKKVQCQVKGKSDKQNNITHEVKENKERYQTRAITRKEIASKLNKKRKQDGDEESNKKICTRNKILEPLVENSSEIVVSFSYLKSRHLQEMKQFVDKTGGSVTDEITQCTVLVTDKIRCTMKILSAIARGCPIVNANWLKHSYTVKMFQDANDFLIVDKDAERKYQFKLKESLAKAKTKKLLDGYNVLVTPSVKPGPQEMKVIIACAGGNYVLNWTDTQCTKELIVTCDKDRNRWKPAWDNDFAKIIDSDTLVTSIIRQKLTI